MNEMVQGRRVMYSETFFIVTNDAVSFELTIDGTRFIVLLVFQQGETDAPPNVNWRVLGNQLTITATGWGKHAETAAMPKIAQFVEFNGQPVGFFFTHLNLGPKFQSVTIQFYKGGSFDINPP